MKADVAPAILFGIGLAAGVIVLLVAASEPNFCAQPDAVEQIQKGAWCFEFWLNRYQTLLGGLFTLVGAAAATITVIGQVRIARKQLDVMMGNIEPDFIIVDPRTSFQDFQITIINENRRPICVTRLSVVKPRGLDIFISHEKTIGIRFGRTVWGRQDIYCVVEGSRPSAEAASTKQIWGIFAMSNTDAASINRKAECVVLEINYHIFGEEKNKVKSVRMYDANIGMTSTPAEHENSAVYTR